jgi:hypothetical protein
LSVAPQMHRKRRKGSGGDTLNTAGSAKGGGARRLQALAHFGRKAINSVKI